MAMSALVKPLLALPIFQGLKPLQLTEIVRRAERIIYRAGDVIVAENEQSDAAIVIISGRCVRLDVAGDEARSQGEVVSEGSIIAELAMLVEIVHGATIIAQGPVKALRITREKMHAHLKDDMSLTLHFTSLIIERLQLLAEELSAVESLLPDPKSTVHETRLRFAEILGAA
jgi:CRP-like cAMP-binding protein